MHNRFIFGDRTLVPALLSPASPTNGIIQPLNNQKIPLPSVYSKSIFNSQITPSLTGTIGAKTGSNSINPYPLVGIYPMNQHQEAQIFASSQNSFRHSPIIAPPAPVKQITSAKVLF